MTAIKQAATPVSRRSVLKGAGALVISIGTPIGLEAVLSVQTAMAQGAELSAHGRPPLVPEQLSSYLAVNADGSVAAYFGKIDLGQGLLTAIAQIVAEELDVPFERVTVYVGDTSTTINQGDASGSTGVIAGGKQMRFAAAEARRVLLVMASQRLRVPTEILTVTDGIVSSGSRHVRYAELIGGRYFNVLLAWNGKTGNALFAPGKARPKDPQTYRIVGKSFGREDVAPKIYGTQEYVTDVRVPNMMHARMIRPQVAGTVPVQVDESSIAAIAGARVVWQQGLLAVVAENEWDALRAAQSLQVQWSEAKPAFVDPDALYDHIRNAPVRKQAIDGATSGDVDAAFRAAARFGSGQRLIEAEYEWPFQSHASLGPACAVADVRDGQATCWTGSQKFHFARQGVAGILVIPVDAVRVIWRPGPGSYGRNDAGDAVADAAVLSQAVGRPVRLQYTREQATGWDPKAPASIHRARAVIDGSGNVTAYEFVSKGFSRLDLKPEELEPCDTLAGQLRGVALKSDDGFNVPGDSYLFANRRSSWQTIAPLLDRASPLRTTHMRDPVGPQIHFASESFIDELAATLAMDPVQFRLRHLRDPRDVAVVRAAAERAGWQARRAAARVQQADILSGRGFAYVRSRDTRVAIVAEVQVDRRSGRVWARKVTLAHDCGLVINPAVLHNVIEGNVVQGLSRALFEEVRFDQQNVRSKDWITYPILDIRDAPESIDVVLLNNPQLSASGAGEPATRPVAAAIANAVFDATGVRIRRAPLSPQRVKAALTASLNG